MSLANWDFSSEFDQPSRQVRPHHAPLPKGWYLLGAGVVSCALWAGILVLALEAIG